MYLNMWFCWFLRSIRIVILGGLEFRTYILAGIVKYSLELGCIKVAEHSFCARFCWCESARAQRYLSSIERSFYLFKTRIICAILLYYWTQCIDDVSLLLQRYVPKGKDVKNEAILSFSLLPGKNTIKCSACAVARKIETDCFCRNLPISSDPVVRISRNLAKQ